MRQRARTSVLGLVAVLMWPALGAGVASGAASATPTPPTSLPPTAVTPAALRVVSVSPRRTRAIPGDARFSVRFSVALAATQRVAVRLVPALAGRWKQVGPRALQFMPASAFAPGQVVRLVVPAGITAADGAKLRRSLSYRFRVGQPSPVRLVQLLAGLRFLPVHFESRANPRERDAAGQLRALYTPPRGRFVFGHGWPLELHELWEHDRALVIRGALMAFESQHGLPMDGVAGPRLWDVLRASVSRGQMNRAGYSYAVASEASPETLTVYHNGSVVVRTLANTGIPASPTALGTFPVYERLRSQVMRGVNPDGVPYADFVQWVAYFNGGDAVHYMPRASYGYPQSLGCVELPYAAAQQAWGYLTYGTLVTVV